jgi:hypothetical protein
MSQKVYKINIRCSLEPDSLEQHRLNTRRRQLGFDPGPVVDRGQAAVGRLF